MEKDLQQVQSNVKRIAIVGPESTGKTTLSKSLSDVFQTEWVAEFAREYLQNKWDVIRKICEPHDLLPIVKGQIDLENNSIQKANNFLFCDTNAFVTYVYSKIYYKETEDWLKKCAKDHHYDLFILTDIDVPWAADDLRDAPNNRAEHLEIFEKYLIKFEKPYIKINGDVNQRLIKVQEILEDFEISLNLGFNSLDFCQLYKEKICFKNIQNHVDKIKKGANPAKLNRISAIGDGILSFSENEILEFSQIFDEAKDNLKITKFIPASGAATRMFQFLQEFIADFDYQKETLNNYINRKKAKNLNLFFLTLNKFPFYGDLMKKIRENLPNYDTLDRNNRAFVIVDFLISSKGLNYATLPKAVIPFHQMDKKNYMPIETHINDFYELVSNLETNELHFTVSENHTYLFDNFIKGFEEKNISKIKFTYSFQKRFTNTLAFSEDFKPLKINQNFIIRPSGHGALIENLNDLNGDLVFIQNIDNITLHNKQAIINQKKALAGILLKIQSDLFYWQRKYSESVFNDELANDIKDFLIKTFYTDFDDLFDGLKLEFKKEIIKKLLFKPIRVCGMVKNEGEAGGGPFWVENDKGYLELQIIETSQINTKDDKQNKILQQSTHFNPVDLVCGLKDYEGKKYNLLNFVDENAGFIVKKNQSGQEFYAYELPGLWNGAMAKWHTIFVDVPLFTFNPVKSVIDLLKPNHQEHAFEI